MFKKIFSYFLLSFIFIFGFNFVFASPNLDNLNKLGGGFNKPDTGQNVVNIAGKGKIKTINDVPTIINKGIGVVLGVFATIILGVIIYAGIKMITSNGKMDSYQEGTKLLKTAVIAMLIILLAYAISTFVLKTISLLSTNQ